MADFLPAGSALLALIGLMIGAWIAIRNVNKQLEHSRNNTDKQLAYDFTAIRYDAVRHKRAVAKALLQEVKLLNDHLKMVLNEDKVCFVTPIVYPALLSEIGRLHTDQIESVVYFYGYYQWYFAGSQMAKSVRPADLPGVAEKAINALNKFIDDTEKERCDTLADLKRYRQLVASRNTDFDSTTTVDASRI